MNGRVAPALRVAIDLTALLPQSMGVDVVLHELVRHLTRIDSEIHYTLLVNREDLDRFAEAPNVAVKPVSVRGRLERGLFQQCLLPWQLGRGDFDVLHSPAFLMPMCRGRAKHLLTVHDLTFFTIPELHRWLHGTLPFRAAVAASIRRAHMIHVPSAAVRDDLMRQFPHSGESWVRVTPWGIGEQFSPSSAPEADLHAKRLKLPVPYILYLGTIEPRKNLLMLIEAFRALVHGGNATHHLVLAGNRGWNVDNVYRLAESPELRGRVHFLGYVAESDLPWVYRAATLFVYPSLAEGFGFPPLEAMACGLPVIASRASSLVENLSGAAELVPVSDRVALSEALARLLGDENSRRHWIELGLRRAAEFRWEQTAKLVVECYRELATGRREVA